MIQFSGAMSFGPPHPTDEELLAFLDSELSPKDLERVRLHVSSCTTCQAEITALERVLDSVQQFRNSQMAEAEALQTEAVERFHAHLIQHAHQKLAQPVSLPPARETRPRDWRLASLLRYRIPVVASVVAVALVLTTTFSLLETTASADVLLTRTEEKENLRAPADSPVSRSVLHMELIDLSTGKQEASGEYVLLADKHAQEARLETNSKDRSFVEWTSAGDDFLGDLAVKAFRPQHYFDQALLHYMQQQNFFPDTSASQFRKLIANRGRAGTHVRKGNGSYGLDYAFAALHPSGIRNAVLWVAKKSYDPFQLSIFTANGSDTKEYRFTRKSRVHEVRTPELAQLLSSPLNKTVAVLGANTPNPPAILPRRYGQIPASSSEVRATELLHNLGACLGEEVYVYPMSDGTTLVQGLVDNANRRQMLINALVHADVSIHSEIYTPDQLESGIHLFQPPYGGPPPSTFKGKANSAEQAADFSGRQMAFHDELLASIQNEGKGQEEADKSVAFFSIELSALAEKLLLNSWALQRLDEQFPSSRTTQLVRTDLEVLNSLRQEHRQHIRQLAERETSMLSRIPLANSLAQAIGSEKEPATASPRQILALAQEQEKLVRALFTASQESARKSEDLSRLLQILRLLQS